MKLVKFVKVTEKDKDEAARSLGWENEGDLLKDAEFETLVGLWIDTDEDIDEGVAGTLATVSAVKINNREFDDTWYSTVYTREIDLLVVEPGVGVMSIVQHESIFC